MNYNIYLIPMKSGVLWYKEHRAILMLLDMSGWDSEEAFLRQELTKDQFFSKVSKSKHTWNIERL